MTPIISPWWFYLFDISQKLADISLVAAIIIGVCLIAWFICEGPDSRMKKMLPAFFISIFFMVFTPTKETCYQMAAASLVTPDNLTIAGETATDVIDYIVESVDKVLDEKGDE